MVNASKLESVTWECVHYAIRRGETGWTCRLQAAMWPSAYEFNADASSRAFAGSVHTQHFESLRTDDAPCPWMAFANAPWIHLPGATQGTGLGQIQITVDPNPGGERTGYIALNNAWLLVRQFQDGAGPSLSGEIRNAGTGTRTFATTH